MPATLDVGDLVEESDIIRTEVRCFPIADAQSDNCNFYHGALYIWPDGKWGWTAKVKAFRDGKEWGNKFYICRRDLTIAWLSDLKYKLLIGGGIEEEWSQMELGPDQKIKDIYAIAVGAGIGYIRTNT